VTVLVPARSSAGEWLDRRDHDPRDLEAALRDIRSVNRLLGGESVLLDALTPLLGRVPRGSAVEILDVGTGMGDLPLAMARHARAVGLHPRVIAVDIDPVTVEAAARHTARDGSVRVLRADALDLPFPEGSFDFVTCSMFLHHFGPEEVVRLLASFRSLARRSVVVNDLRRHVLPWAFIAVAARATRRHPMFVHDAPLSVLRGFTPNEMREAALAAGAKAPTVRRRWPFRLVLTLDGGKPA
jgi:SAM-dependent methyltransferase